MLSFHRVTSPLRRLSNATHTCSSPPGLFYKLEQLRFTASTAGHGRPGPGWLWMESYEQETRAGSRPFFLPWLSVSTHHREKQLGYKLAGSLTLTNVLLWTTKQPARSATRLSCRSLPTLTRERIQEKKQQLPRGSVCHLSADLNGCWSTNAEKCVTTEFFCWHLKSLVYFAINPSGESEASPNSSICKMNKSRCYCGNMLAH